MAFWVTAELVRLHRETKKNARVGFGSDCSNFRSFRGCSNRYQSIIIIILILILLINIDCDIVNLHYFFRVDTIGMCSTDY